MSVDALTLRDANANDTKTVFEWRNDPWIIAKGSLNKTVSWEEHSNWFNGMLSDPDRHMFIIEIDGSPAGQCRFIRDGNAAEISVYVMKNHIGQGYGSAAITKACQQIFQLWEIDRIHAYILENNEHSRKTFEKCRFEEAPNCDRNEKDDHKLFCLKR